MTEPLPFANTRFRVEIEGVPASGAVEVIFPEARIVGRRRDGSRVRYGNLIVRRGLTASSDWYGWWDAARRGRRATKRAVRVALLTADGRDARAWLFRDAAPVAYQLSPLHARGNEAVLETLELTIGQFDAAS
jgi:phage tail-like protein